MRQNDDILKPQWLFYGISFFIPIAGIVIGAVYMSKPDRGAKDFGKRCMIAAVAYFIAACCCIIAYAAIYVVLAMLFRVGDLGVF